MLKNCLECSFVAQRGYSKGVDGHSGTRLNICMNAKIGSEARSVVAERRTRID